MTISEALKKYSGIEADLLLGHVLKQPKEFLHLYPSEKLTSAQIKRYRDLAAKRVKGVPAAYLLGYKHFYGLRFKVNRNVLIPRPETEWLVDQVLLIAAKKAEQNPKKTLRIIDVGTGSGCIAISIAKYLESPKAQIYGTDISEKALAIARQNTQANKTTVSFSKHDLVSGLKGKYDLIVANLPYVPVSDYKRFYENLKYEPELALTDGTDNFVLIKKALKQFKAKLNTNGSIILETDPASIKELRILAKSLFSNKKITITADIHGLNRFIKIS